MFHIKHYSCFKMQRIHQHFRSKCVQRKNNTFIYNIKLEINTDRVIFKINVLKVKFNLLNDNILKYFSKYI